MTVRVQQRPAVHFGLIVAVALLSIRPAFADEEARAWLAGMTQALAESTYQGDFLHLGNGRVEKLRILHRVKDGVVNEHLLSLSGRGREVIRIGGEVQCYLPDQRQVLVESHVAHGSLLGTLPSFDDNLEANYRVEMAGRAQSVLGRPARVVAINPRDGYRFGYRVWIDEGTHMPVRTELCDANGAVLEQVLFTELKVGGVLADAAFRPAIQADGFAWIRQAAAMPHPAQSALPMQLMQLPPGFRVSSSGDEVLPGSSARVTHVVLSDGLASVSVFIEEPPAPPRMASEGEGRVGSSYAYARVVGGRQVTAVGEVPPVTVEFIASGVTEATRPGLTPRP